MEIITAKNLEHSYIISGRRIRSLRGISFSANQGELIAIIGKNGCGKSTLAKHINALIPLQNGELTVNGYDAGDSSRLMDIRHCCGMVFQNPDNQFVSSIVDEDIKFGLKNFNMPCDDNAVEQALKTVGMNGFEKRAINSLSGGQKQKIAIAGVLAIKPKIIILDEATSMLPPEGRKEVLELIKKLHNETKITFIMITQYVEEASIADRVILMKDGEIIANGATNEVLSNKALLSNAGIKPPFTVNVYYDLLKRGVKLSEIPLTNERLVELLCQS